MNTLKKVMAVGYGCYGVGDDSVSALNRWAKEAGRHILDQKVDVTVEFRALPEEFEMDGLFNLNAARIEKLPSITMTWGERMKIWGGADYLEEKLHPVSDAIYALKDSEIDW